MDLCISIVFSSISIAGIKNYQKKNGLIPKIKDKILLTSEIAPIINANKDIAPIINANKDDLRKILGIITRLVDGKGYQSHSRTHGYRGYPPMMFTWIVAGIEIPSKMWTMLSQLGFKIYFFRPIFKKQKMTLKKLQRMINYQRKNKSWKKHYLII
jgi:hypothetical protein